EYAHESGPFFRCQEEDEAALTALGLHACSLLRESRVMGGEAVNDRRTVGEEAQPGKAQVMVSPPPGVWPAETVPPAALTMCLTIASPSPVPREDRARSVR